MIIVFDMDETLIHSMERGKGDFYVDDYSVIKRPGLDKFLNALTNDPTYRIAFWSAGEYEYVHAVLENIIPSNMCYEFVMTLNDCNELRDKPLSVALDVYHSKHLWDPTYDPDVTEMLIIDDRVGVTGYNSLHHLLIKPFEGDMKDKELYKLWHYLNRNRGERAEHMVLNWK